MKKIFIALLYTLLCFQAITASAQSITTSPVAGSPFCQGSTVVVSFTILGNFSPLNVFTAQLSNAAGSFAAPVNIGTLNGNTAGAIQAVFPNNQAPGTQYRIRVVASLPAVTGAANNTNLTILAPSSNGTKEWVGGSGFWNNPSNWSPCGVPNTSDNVIIGAGDAVTILAGYAATAKSIYQSNSGDLALKSDAVLQINGSTEHAINLNGTGTSLLNLGTISIGFNSAVFSAGIQMTGACSFTNSNGATIHIDSITNPSPTIGYGIRMEGGTFSNSGTLKIGNSRSITNDGISIIQGTFNNQGTGQIEINRILGVFGDGHGIEVSGSGAVFNNTGSIKIGNITTVVRTGIRLADIGSFTNNSAGTIEINRVTEFGIIADGALPFNNSGAVHIGNLHPLGSVGWLVFSGSTIVNNPGATITVDNTGLSGIQLNDSGTLITNNGTLQIGNIGPIGLYGIWLTSSGSVVNGSTGIIEVNRLALDGIVVVNESNMINSGIVKVGNTAPVLGQGIVVSLNSNMVNNITGIIDMEDGAWIYITDSAFSNSGMIKLKNAITNEAVGFVVYGTMTNTTSGQIEISTKRAIFLHEPGQFDNFGNISIGVIPGFVETGISVDGIAPFNNHSGATISFDNFKASPGIRLAIGCTDNSFFNSGTMTFATNGGAVPDVLDKLYPGADTPTLFNNGTMRWGNVTGIGIGKPATIENNSGGIIETATGGKLRIDGILNNNSGANIKNNGNGLITINKALNNFANGKITNNSTAIINIERVQFPAPETGGILTNNGSITNSGILQTTGLGASVRKIINNNVITNYGTISLNNSPFLLENNTSATIHNKGTLKGNGTIVNNGNIENYGAAKTSPGITIGTLSVTGSYQLGSGTLELTANGTNPGFFDVLNVSGTSTLSGAALTLTTGFTPVNGDQITVLNAGVLTDTFTTINVPAGWFVNYNKPSSGKITLSFGAPLPLVGGAEDREWMTNLNEEPGLTIFPNPTTGRITLVTGDFEPERVRVLDVLGRVLTDQPFTGRYIDLTAFPSGRYLLMLQKGATVKVQEVVKK